VDNKFFTKNEENVRAKHLEGCPVDSLKSTTSVIHFNSRDHDCSEESIMTRTVTRPHKIPKKVINAHAEVSISQIEISAHA